VKRLLVLLTWLWCGAAQAQLDLTRLAGESDLASLVGVLEDDSQALTLADVQRRTFEHRDVRELSLGFSSSALWLQFDAANSGANTVRWLLELGEPTLDHVDLYVLHRDGHSEHQRGGDRLPFVTRVIPHAKPTFELESAAGSSARYYLRVQSEDVMRVPVRAYRPTAYYASHERETLLQWLFYGAQLMAAVYFLGAYALVRRVEYLRYAFVSLAFLLVLMCLYGQQAQFLFSDAPALSARMLPLSLGLAFWLTLLFMRDVVARVPLMVTKTVIYERAAWAAFSLVALALLAPVGVALRVIAALLLLASAAAPAIIYLLSRIPAPELALYRRCWWTLGSSIPIAVLRYANVLPAGWLDWALPVGFTAHAIWISLALPAWMSGMEAKLAAVNEQLQSNVQELSQALANAEQANEKAQRATKSKDEFLATMSHELRTPLNAIINIPQGLIGEFETVRAARCSHCDAAYLLDAGDQVGADTRCEDCARLGTLVEGSKVEFRGDQARCLRFLQKIEASGQHLLQMVNGVLDYSKLEAGRFELALGAVELDALLRDVGDQLVDLAQRKRITLVFQHSGCERPLLADRLRLKQVLINLVDNAIKFSEAGSTVTVRASSQPDGELIEVEDQGIGIAPADHKRIFTSFEQVHKGDTRKYGGTGLGLSISRSLVRMHGGELSVRSELGKGSTFVVRLPRLPVDQAHNDGARVLEESA
jgi:signal transduction histidine kinase